MIPSTSLQIFKRAVGIKFQLYNSLFTSLPFHKIEKTGILVSLLLINCEEGYKKELSPEEIIDAFFVQQTSAVSDEEKLDALFRFVQFIERQVVLFDALEDAAFTDVNDMGGKGTLKHLALDIDQNKQEELLKEKLKDFNVRIVLTAHPTQFYRGAVLGIIHDLTDAVRANNESQVYSYLQQLGRTAFFQHIKPTPLDEALTLIWYLRNVFYHAAGNMVGLIKSSFPDVISPSNPIFTMGFWPGGDRDGNPFVLADTTLSVAKALREGILKSYFSDVKKLERRLTFKGVDSQLAALEKKLHDTLFVDGHEPDISQEYLLNCLFNVKSILSNQYNNLFVALVDDLINKIETFGLYFATLDIRQESTVHEKMLGYLAENGIVLPNGYQNLSQKEKIDILTTIDKSITPEVFLDATQNDTIKVIQTIKQIQLHNGEKGCNRYIISQCQSALNAMEVYGLFLLSGWKKESLTIDIVPLFETVDDLQSASLSMQTLYENPTYRNHLKMRGNKQTIMLGFSDGTKDGGYLMANWSIYKAKEELSDISKQYGVDVVFFDGRGGPPARGGGKTHQFYASMGKNISNKEIQLTIQGQTVSSNFGTIESAQFNIEQLVHAGITNHLNSSKDSSMEIEEKMMLKELAEVSYECYNELKNHPQFTNYLTHISPLRFYAETNIGSRPTKRGASNKLSLKDLRAIPFVGAWSQIKQNLTGYYGVGTALQSLERLGKWEQIALLYQKSLFFKTLLDNCEMAMLKCFFPLTAYLKDDKIYGGIWKMVFDEYNLTQEYIFKLSGSNKLMAAYPVDQLSIEMRERIVLPLVTVQQFALTKIRELEEKGIDSNLKKSYEKLVMRCSFGIINAGRNSA